MTYHVSRNGQTYGPYTLEDLQRYVASGNVLPTDMAKPDSDETAGFVPVSQILGYTTQSTAFPPAEPFSPAATAYGAPPSAYATGPAASPYPDPPNLHWGLYLLFSIITCTLFSKVFTIIQAVYVKRVQPNSNALYGYIAYYVLWFISLIYNTTHAVAFTGRFNSENFAEYYRPHRLIPSTVLLIVLIVVRFLMSTSLEEHYNGPEPLGLKPNPVLTFFFGGVYFQALFNRVNAIKQATRMGQPRPW